MQIPLFVRSLTDAERQALEAGLRSSQAFTLRRAQILLASARGQTIPAIAGTLSCDEQTVRNAVHAFNQQGVAALTPGSSRPHTIHAAFDEAVLSAADPKVAVGDSVTAGPRTVTREDIDHFAEFTGDTFYAHTDEEAAAANPLFGGIVAHGYLVLSFAAGLFVAPEPGPVLANYGLDKLRFRRPVRPGDELTVTLTAAEISPREDADFGDVRWDVVITNQDATPVASYQLLTLVAKQWPR